MITSEEKRILKKYSLELKKAIDKFNKLSDKIWDKNTDFKSRLIINSFRQIARLEKRR